MTARTFTRPMAAVQGDAITIDRKLTHVGASCDCEKTGYFCITCRQKLANRAQLDMHLEGAPLFIHNIARECGPHGLTAAPRTRGCR